MNKKDQKVANKTDYLVIGNSASGLSAAGSIRRNDKYGRITVVTEEVYTNYSKPLITYYLAGKVSLDGISFRDNDFYTKRNIGLITGTRIKTIDIDNSQAVTDRGEKIEYDLLISIPPHRGVKAMLDSGISDEKGWLPSNKYTLRYEKSPSERYDEVYVIGDGGPITMNKMGINAHFQALKTGQNLINDYHGNGVTSIYKGEQGCPIVESSYTPNTDGKAYMVTWTYGNPAKSFSSGKMGWLIYRMYYYIYFDLTAKGIM